MEQDELLGKSVLVIGGATGIGRAAAFALADAGYRVAIAGRRVEKLEEAASGYRGKTPITCHSVDVADRESVMALVGWFQETVGPIDVVINAAGVNIKDRSMADMDPEQWDFVMRVNATGAYNVFYAVLPAMRERQAGLIVNVSSIAGKRALELGGIAYCASKFAMTALGTAVGQEVAKDGVRITNVYPGEVDTPLLAQRPHPVTPEHRARMLQPADIAAMIVAICQLPPRAHVPEIVIKPRLQDYC